MNAKDTTIARRMAAYSLIAQRQIDRRRALHGELVMERVDNDETDGPDDDDADDDDADDTDDADKDDDKDDDGDDPSELKRRAEEAEAEVERVKRHRAAADRKAADLERQLAEAKRGKPKPKAKEDDDKTNNGPSERETELESSNKKLTDTVQAMRIDMAFLRSNKHDWADPGDALRLADLSEVEIEEDGTVVGLGKALDKLAKDKPHLVKKKDDDDDAGPSGSSRNGRRKGKQGQGPTRETLAGNYPILRSRGGR